MDNLQRLRQLVKIFSNSSYGLIIINTLAVVFIGLASSQVDKWDSPWTLIIAFCGLVVLAIDILMSSAFRIAPVATVDAVINTLKGNRLENDYARALLINRAIADSLIALNSQTCNLSGEPYYDINGDSEHFCDEGLEMGLQHILSPLSDTIHQTTKTSGLGLDVTIAVFLKNMPVATVMEEGQIQIDSHNELAVIKDDNNSWRKCLSDSLISKKTPKGFKLELRQIKDRCFSNITFERNVIKKEGTAYTVMTSPIPVVCNESSVKGCLIILMRGVHPSPEDLKDVLSIYNRIISNWVAKYFDCFEGQHKEIKDEIELKDGSIVELYWDNTYNYKIEANSLPPDELKEKVVSPFPQQN